MPQSRNISYLVRENKKLFIIIAVVLFLIELEIFAIAALKSGRKSWLQVIDTSGNVIHETDGNDLSEFNKYYFEKTFGPFDQYSVNLVAKDYPFPFRAWFAAAIGIPIGVILLFAFAVKAYMALFYGEEKRPSRGHEDEISSESRLEKIIAKVSRFNIFTIGFLLFLAVFSYWVIPNMITYIGRVSVETLIQFKWVFLALAFAVLGLVIWLIYLRYLLAKKTIESQTEIEKHRLQIEYGRESKSPPKLEYNEKGTRGRPFVTWDKQDVTRQEGVTGAVRMKDR